MRIVTRRQRAVTLVAALVTIVFVAATISSSAGAMGDTDTRASADSTFLPHTARQAAFQDQMRKLWEDHVTWTRLTIVGAVGGTNRKALPDIEETVQRLQANQDDIGAATVPFFGEEAGKELATLLHAHISGAIELLLAAKAGDTDGVEAAKARWYANGQEIADFLAAANPQFWPQKTMRDAMLMHL